MNKEHILREIKRTAEENEGVPFGHRRFFRETGFDLGGGALKRRSSK
jgi:hypothetical protein